MSQVSFFAAFIAGLLSFLSPCILPLVPAYIFYLAGKNPSSSNKETKKTETFLHALMFVIGFSLVFIAFGALFSYLGKYISPYRWLARLVGGFIIIIFGLNFIGLFKIKFLSTTRTIKLKKTQWGYLGSIVLGMAFAFGWTPCVDPILASILYFATETRTILSGVFLLSIYSMGLAIPFLIVGLGIDRLNLYITKISKHLHYVTIGSGILLLIFGIFIISGHIALLINAVVKLYP